MASAYSEKDVSLRSMDLLTLLRKVMWDNVGVVRTMNQLKNGITLLRDMRDESYELFNQFPSMQTSAVRDAATSGYAVAQAAIKNKRSIGAHYIVSDDEMTTASSNLTLNEYEEELDEEQQQHQQVAAAMR